MFVDLVGGLQVGSDQHESEIGLRRHDAEGKQLRGVDCPDLLNELRQICFGRILFFTVEQLPLPVFDPVKQMETMPAFLGDERGAFVGHRA